MMNIFISYTMDDPSIDYAYLSQVKSALQKWGNVFIDILDNQSISPQYEIFKKICSSHYVIVLTPSNSQTLSKWVLSEISIARILNKPIAFINSSSFFEEDIQQHLISFLNPH